MDPAIIDWISQPDIRRLINATPPGLICGDKRVLNVLKNNKNLSLSDFIDDSNRRMRLRNWGKATERKFTYDLAMFLIRNLRQKPGIIMNQTDVSAHDIESFGRVTKMGMDALKELYSQRHSQWWELASKNGKDELLMVRIGQHLGFDWPFSLRHLPLSHFRKPAPEQLLRMRGYGKIKLKMVLTGLAWAALTDEKLVSPDPIDAWEAYRMANLSPKERDIIEARFRSAARHRSATLEDVAKQYGNKTRERIRQIEAKAVEKMKLLGLQDAVREWLYQNAEHVWSELGDSQGNISGYGIGERAPRSLPKDLAWAFRVAEITPYEVLSKIGEMIAGDWYRRTDQSPKKQTA